MLYRRLLVWESAVRANSKEGLQRTARAEARSNAAEVQRWVAWEAAAAAGDARVLSEAARRREYSATVDGHNRSMAGHHCDGEFWKEMWRLEVSCADGCGLSDEVVADAAARAERVRRRSEEGNDQYAAHLLEAARRLAFESRSEVQPPGPRRNWPDPTPAIPRVLFFPLTDNRAWLFRFWF